MDRVALFVDAGYLYAVGAKSVTGADGTRRHDISLDIPAFITFLIETAEKISKQSLLRVYWYDAAPYSRPNTDHQILASTDNVKLRLGVLNGFGQQKGVDGKIIADLTELSRNRAFADAVLLGGDEDLRIGVELAQEFGSRVHLLTIEGSSMSPTLRQESDTLTTIARSDLSRFLSVRTSGSSSSSGGSVTTLSPAPVLARAAPTIVPSMAASGAPTTMVGVPLTVADGFEAAGKSEIKAYLASLAPTEQTSLVTALKGGNGVPAEHDGRLLARTRKSLGRDLDAREKAKMRRMLRSELGI